LVWDSNSCSSDEIAATLECVDTTIDSSLALGAASGYRYALRCTLAYYGLHYVAFARNPSTQMWTVFDDSTVRVLSEQFRSVVTTAARARLQPLLLFYERIH